MEKTLKLTPLRRSKLTPHCKGKSIKYNAELNTGNIGCFGL
jgi:hypothetical protein